MSSIPEPQRECLRQRIPGHGAVDGLLEDNILMDEEGSNTGVDFDVGVGEIDEPDISDSDED
jgi:hypothetical protein